MKRSTRAAAAVFGAAALALTGACSNPNAGASGAASSAASSTVDADQELRVGFFGFAKANSFAQAAWAGVQEAAQEDNATAEFVDSNFDGAVQVQQLTDAVTSKRFDVVVIQANDGTAITQPVKQALAAGITVVVEFTPIGGRFDTIEPQVDGVISIVDAPTANGEGLAEMGLDACTQLAVQPCQVAYLQGFDNYPLDAARTEAAVNALKAGGADVVASPIGGYTPDSGRTAMQNVLQANPDVDVVIGSSQAIEGASALTEGRTDILYVGNGGSTQAYAGVMDGSWYGTYVIPEKTDGKTATELGLKKHRGEEVPVATDSADLTPFKAIGTKEALTGLTAEYSD
ncbi:sugar ABC transporter substrate-binding protein [Streptomyces sp. NP160]|uniref:sugar ABC transporter substrate-binding protein n=1 Tax=Streptomyces sp. NP160 TaxID=2586637 RepID=UPI00111AD5DC|nr:sugar ABC transporter substrate-binding protein [Streptomyces sp. NP160]TNM60200.1 sugar ABC transporter substrate-binding protein [Streptomyces sp. NP160]